jgi:hypothetical protein
VIAQLRGRRRSLAVGIGQAMPTATVGVGQAMPTATVGVDMAVGVALVRPSA